MTKPNTKAAPQAADLRQRAAQTRDIAGRFIRRGTPAQAPSDACASQDPALAVVALFSATSEALGKALDAEVPDELVADLQDAVGAAYDRLRAVRPTTPAGVRALADAWGAVLEGERGGEPGVTLADQAADSLIAGVGGCVPIRSMTGSDENVAALIEEHRAFFADWDRLSGVWNEMVPDDPGYGEAMAASDLPGRREVTAYEALFSAQPTTLAGAAALASYLGEAVRRTRIDAEPSEGERALGTIAEALQGLSSAAVDPPHPDAALFALGDQFMAAWVAEEADGDEPEYRACTRIAKQIMRTPAATVAGYGIKALLLARLDSDATGPHAPIAPHGPADSWWNVLRQVQEGAAWIAGAPDIGIAMSADAGPETGLPAAAEPARQCAPIRPDFSELSVEQLARLYPVLVRASEVLSSAESAPCFWYADQTRTDAGCIINWETDRMHRLASDVVSEIRRRQPADDDEAEERANTLLSHMVLTGGVAERPELIAEINATWGA